MGTGTTHVYLIPGMFGFGKLAGYDYFSHMEMALARRFHKAGVELHIEVLTAPPTASIRRRAAVVASQIAQIWRSIGTASAGPGASFNRANRAPSRASVWSHQAGPASTATTRAAMVALKICMVAAVIRR